MKSSTVSHVPSAGRACLKVWGLGFGPRRLRFSTLHPKPPQMPFFNVTTASEAFLQSYRGTSLIGNRLPLGPYSRTMPRALLRVLRGWAFSYERGTPAGWMMEQRPSGSE